MYYEEQIIHGVLHWRGTPDGAWRTLSRQDMTDKITRLRAELAAKDAECEGLRKDAERYRYLRDAGDIDLCVRGEEQHKHHGYDPTEYWRDMVYGEALNSAIDAALSQPQASPVGDWWYVVDKRGHPYKCESESRAREVVTKLNREWPNDAPHRAGQFYEVASVGRGTDRQGIKESMRAALADGYWPIVKHDGYGLQAQPEQIALSPEKDAEFQRVIEGPVQPEPSAWMFQHEETGSMVSVENDGINTLENFAKNNPRHFFVYPLFKHPPQPAPDTFTPDEYEFQLWQDDNVQASGSGSREDVITEANHYAAMYSQDGPVEIIYFARADVTARLVGEQGEG